MCEALAAAGLRVVAVARRRERLEELQQRLVASGVPIADFLPVVCDITKVPIPTNGSIAVNIAPCILQIPAVGEGHHTN